MIHKHQPGQAIVLVALAMIALVAIIGLAIDGGTVYTMRRQSQNAADSASIAGTQIVAELISTCGNGGSSSDWNINTTVRDYATRNGIDLIEGKGDMRAWYMDKDLNQLAVVGGGYIPNGTTGVQVSVVTTQTTYLMKLFSRDNMSAAATAIAMTGPVFELGGGILPIGVEDDAVISLGNGTSFTVLDDGMYYGSSSSNVGWLNMSHIYNMDHYTQGDPLTRTYVSNAGNGGCAWNGDLVDVGATGLEGWASGQCPYPYPIYAGGVGGVNGDWIHGVSGMDTSSLSAICDNYPPGSKVVLPIFDVFWSPGTMTDSGLPEPWLVSLNKTGWVSDSNNQNYYHVDGFVAAEILECVDTGGNKHITAQFVSVIVGEGRFNPNDGFGSNDPGTCNNSAIMAVQLWQ